MISIRMEDLVESPTLILQSHLQRTFGDDLDLPLEEEFHFSKMTGGRKLGDQDIKSHFRSGDPNNWRVELPKSTWLHVAENYNAILSQFYPESLQEIDRSMNGTVSTN